MVDSLHAQVRLIEDLRATNAAQETTILELRAENERLKETIEVLKEAIETLKAEIRQLKRLPGKPITHSSHEARIRPRTWLLHRHHSHVTTSSNMRTFKQSSTSRSLGGAEPSPRQLPSRSRQTSLPR